MASEAPKKKLTEKEEKEKAAEMEDAKKAAEMQAKYSKQKEENSCVRSKEVDVTDEIAKDSLKENQTLYFQGCKGGKYTLSTRVTKVLIEGCSNCEFTFGAGILTSMVEVWHCDHSKFHFKTAVKTLQIDMCDQLECNFEEEKFYQQIIWSQCNDVAVTNGALKTQLGFKEMVEVMAKQGRPEVLDHKTDQFIVRVLDGKLTSELCIRLKNGHMTTEREALAWEKNNTRAKEAYMENFLKESGITVNKKQEKKIQPNVKCPCGSEKKYKKCCMNKPKISGLATDAVGKLSQGVVGENTGLDLPQPHKEEKE